MNDRFAEYANEAQHVAKRTPERIGEWTPERLIGRGAVAAVYLCRGPADEVVAVKWMDQADPALVQRFQTEVDSIRRLEHDCVAAYRGHGEFDGRPFLVMEYIDGVDLRVYAAKLHKRPPLERYQRCRSIGQALCRALQHIHEQGMIHRDVKPSNVLITDADRVVLTDFGVVKDEAALHKTAVGVVVGTMAYAAPEQIHGDVVDARADLFGLGATLYYLLCQRRPFEGVQRGEEARPKPPSHFDPAMPPDLEGLVMRLMAMDPRDRPRDARSVHKLLGVEDAEATPLAGTGATLAAVAECLDRAAEGESLHVRPTGPMGTGKGWVGDLLRTGAQRREIPVVEVLESGAWAGVRQRLEAGEHLLVISPHELTLPADVERVEIRLAPLGVADVRRSLVLAAPKVEQPARVASRLHALTAGLPRLLVAVFQRCGSDGDLVLPDEGEIFAPAEAFLEGLDMDEMEVLSVLALAPVPLQMALIETVSNVPADSVLAVLIERGLVLEAAGRFGLSADLFRAPVLHLQADPEGLSERMGAAMEQRMGVAGSDAPPAIAAEIRAGIDKAESALLAGRLAQGLRAIRRSVDLAQALGDRGLECEAILALCKVLVRLGRLDEAGRRLADATALASAMDRQDLRRMSHALRAWVSMDRQPRSRTAAAGAVERILPMLAGADDRGHQPEDAMLFATLARAAAILGDHGTLQKAKARALEWGAHCPTPLRLGIRLQIARGIIAMGDGKAARELIAPIAQRGADYPLLSWEAERMQAVLYGGLPPAPGILAEGLDPESAQALADRTP